MAQLHITRTVYASPPVGGSGRTEMSITEWRQHELDIPAELTSNECYHPSK
jgi:hypothetical protein